MSYDEIEIEDMVWSEQLLAYTYQCPCGDLFQITIVRRQRLVTNAYLSHLFLLPRQPPLSLQAAYSASIESAAIPMPDALCVHRSRRCGRQRALAPATAPLKLDFAARHCRKNCARAKRLLAAPAARSTSRLSTIR